MADYNPQVPSLAGTVLTANNAGASGDRVLNADGKTVLRVTNGSGGSINVTVAAVQTSRPGDATYPPQTISNNVVAVANGTTRLIGPFPQAFNDATGYIGISWSGTSSVTFEAFKLP